MLTHVASSALEWPFFEEDALACPYFVPREILNDGSWPHPSRLPLGAGWRGDCCASEMAISPQESHIREFCNLGYAARCPHLPLRRDWDAVRFSVARASDEQIILSYVCELGHAPVTHGTLTFSLISKQWLNAQADARVLRLADSYLQTCRSRRAHAVIE